MSEPTTEAPAAQPAEAPAPAPVVELKYPSGEKDAPAQAEVVTAETSEPSPPGAGDGETKEPAPADTPADAAEVQAADYEFSLPSGFEKNEELDKAAREAFAAHGVPKEAAQPLVDLFASTLQANAEAEDAKFQATQKEWLDELNAMPEFKGPTRETSLTALSRLIDDYGSPEARDVLNNPAIGNNPAIVKMMLKVAKELSEGAPATAPRPAPNDAKGKPANRQFGLSYPNTPEISQGT